MNVIEKQSLRKRKSILYLVEKGEYSIGYALLKVEELNDNGKLTEEDYDFLADYLEELLDKEIEMEDGTKYIVIDTTIIDRKKYALISNVDDVLESVFVEVKIDDGITFEEVSDQNLKYEIMKALKNN